MTNYLSDFQLTRPQVEEILDLLTYNNGSEELIESFTEALEALQFYEALGGVGE